MSGLKDRVPSPAKWERVRVRVDQPLWSRGLAPPQLRGVAHDLRIDRDMLGERAEQDVEVDGLRQKGRRLVFAEESALQGEIAVVADARAGQHDDRNVLEQRRALQAPE